MKTLITYLLIGVIYTIVCYFRTEVLSKGRSLKDCYDEITPHNVKSKVPYEVMEAIMVTMSVIFWPIILGLGICGFIMRLTKKK